LCCCRIGDEGLSEGSCSDKPATITDESSKNELNQRLLDATRDGNVQQITDLISAGADINAVNTECYRKYTPLYTSLHLAALFNKVVATKILIDAGANIEAIDDEKRTPLHRAIDNMKIEIVAILIAAKANVNAIDYRG
jgi:ankyrin repeat protein